MIEQIWKVIPLPLWGKIAILVILVMLIILLVKRLLKFKSISFGFSGPAVTFERRKLKSLVQVVLIKQLLLKKAEK